MKAETSKPAETIKNLAFFFIAGNLSVDFVNTEIVENGAPKDLLADFTDFARWTAAADLLEKGEAEKLIADWSGREEIEDAFAQIKSFRRILREMVEQLARGGTASETMIGAINREIRNQNGSVEIRKTANGGFEKTFRADFRKPLQLLAPIAESAADLLCYGEIALLKKCENPACVLYFYDTTKNHRRRWCSQSGCGNRAKVAAFYRRQKQSLKK